MRKAGISAQSREKAMNENDGPFKHVLCIDDDPIGELDFDLNKLRKVNPELAPANLNTNEFLDIDTDIATNNSQPLTVEEIVNDLNKEPHAESHDANGQTEENSTTITPPTRDEIDDVTETLSKLSLFTDDVDRVVKKIKKDHSKYTSNHVTVLNLELF